MAVDEPKISVVVPVYNAERYLHRCVDSILAQTFTDFELLLVDDGSKDSSGAICDEYAEKDERVIVFHKQNGGVSSARNVGLDNARGEWVTFVDSDDYVSADFFDEMMRKSADLIVGHHLHINSRGEISEDDCILPVISISKYSNLRAFLEKYMVFNVMRTPWAKLFRRRLIADIRFDKTLKCGEDTAFVQQYFARCRSLSVIGNAIYYYYENERDDKSQKYGMTVEEAVYHLKRILQYYSELDIKSLQFEKFLLEYFYSLCKGKMRFNSNKWFGDKTIVELIASLKNVVIRRRYLRLQLMRIPLLYNLWFYRSKSL